MVKKIQYKGMAMKETKTGEQVKYSVSSDNGKYKAEFKTFAEATLWLNEMADNNDIAREFMEKICNKFDCNEDGKYKSKRT
jgi:hypothetical protein